LFYPGGGVVNSLPCTILCSAAKRIKESDLVVTQPSNNFGRYSFLKIEFGNPKNNNFKVLRSAVSPEEVTNSNFIVPKYN